VLVLERSFCMLSSVSPSWPLRRGCLFRNRYRRIAIDLWFSA
jgi:hypothetical protein